MKGRQLDMGKPYPVSVYSVHNILDHFFPKDEGISNPTKDMKLSDLFLSIVKELIFQKKG